MARVRPPTLSEIIIEDFLTPRDMTPIELAQALHVDPTKVRSLLSHSVITPELDVRLCRLFQMSDGFFLRMKAECDTLTVEPDQKKAIVREMKLIKTEVIRASNRAMRVKSRTKASSRIGTFQIAT